MCLESVSGIDAMVRVLGITDERTECECCGKTGLKRTVALEFGHDIRFYGIDCAAMTIYGRKSSSNARKVTIAADNYTREQERIAKGKLSRVRTDLHDALYAYIGTGRQMDNRAIYGRDADIVIVDIADESDAEFYESIGFTLVKVLEF